MRISTLWYCIRQGFGSIRKHKLFTLASIGTMADLYLPVLRVLFHRGQRSVYGKIHGEYSRRYGVF